MTDIRVPVEIYNQLDAKAKEKGITVNEYVCTIIRERAERKA